MAVIIIALVWGGFGYGMVILLAGMSSIDPSLHEAASGRRRDAGGSACA